MEPVVRYNDLASSERAALLVKKLSELGRPRRGTVTAEIAVSGANVRLTANRADLIEALAQRFSLRRGALGDAACEIHLDRTGDQLSVDGPAGRMLADCSPDNMAYFAVKGTLEPLFAGSYSGWRNGTGGGSAPWQAMLDLEVTRQLFEASTAAALIHAAWLRGPNGQRVMLAGVSSIGKTTLCRVAQEAGWMLLADDMVSLFAHGQGAPFPRWSWARDKAALRRSPTAPDVENRGRTDVLVALTGRDRAFAANRPKGVAALATLSQALLLSRPEAARGMMAFLSQTRILTATLIDGAPGASWRALERQI